MAQNYIQESQTSKSQLILPSINHKNSNKVQQSALNCIQTQIKRLNASTLQLMPTYKEIVQTIAAIQKRFPFLSIQAILSQIYTKIIEQAQKGQTNQVHLANTPPLQQKGLSDSCKNDRQIVANSFIQRGFGLLNLQRYAQDKNVNLRMDMESYSNIIKQLLLNGFGQLDQYISQHCHNYYAQSMKISIQNSQDLQNVLFVLKACSKLLKPQELMTLSLFIQHNYKDGCLTQISIQSACKLYQSIYQQVKALQQSRIPSNTNPFQIQKYKQQQSPSQAWTQQMTCSLIKCYIRDPTSLPKIRCLLKDQFDVSDCLLSNQNIKYQFQVALQQSIDRIERQMECDQCVRMGARFKRMLKIDEQRFTLICSSAQAVNVRTVLCEFYLMQEFDLKVLVYTILCVNQFINIKQHQQITKSLKVTREQNSICRQEYQFAGKRRKVLVFKRKKRPREKPHY